MDHVVTRRWLRHFYGPFNAGDQCPNCIGERGFVLSPLSRRYPAKPLQPRTCIIELSSKTPPLVPASDKTWLPAVNAAREKFPITSRGIQPPWPKTDLVASQTLLTTVLCSFWRGDWTHPTSVAPHISMTSATASLPNFNNGIRPSSHHSAHN